MKSITINEIATSLNTSRNTVSKVLNGRGYVSDSLKRRIVVEAVEKGYKNIGGELLEYYHSLGDTSHPAEYTVAVLATCPETSSFWTQIITSITNEINATSHRLVYHFMTADEETDFSMPQILQSGRIDGLILINVNNPDAIRQIAELPVAKAYLDLPRIDGRFSVRGDVILPEGESSVYGITQHYISRKKCRALGFVGDITRSRAVFERYRGYRQALEDCGIPFRQEFCLLAGQNSRLFFSGELSSFVSSLYTLPDAFICASDLTAYTLHQKLKELRPEEAAGIHISGYDNMPPLGIAKPFLTSVDLNTAILGKKLVEQLFWRLSHPDRPYETIHLSTGILFRG